MYVSTFIHIEIHTFVAYMYNEYSNNNNTAVIIVLHDATYLHVREQAVNTMFITGINALKKVFHAMYIYVYTKKHY